VFRGYTVRPEEIRYAVKAISEGESMSLKDLFTEHTSGYPPKRRFIIPKTKNQKEGYLD